MIYRIRIDAPNSVQLSRTKIICGDLGDLKIIPAIRYAIPPAPPPNYASEPNKTILHPPATAGQSFSLTHS
jgi:hypothetical protein